MHHLPLFVIVNPSSGAREAVGYLATLEPLLVAAEISYEVIRTEREGDGERIGLALRRRVESSSEPRVHAAVLGGDGTVHELVVGFLSNESTSKAPPTLGIVPLPFGTANALYHNLHPPGKSRIDYASLGWPSAITSAVPADSSPIQSLLSYISSQRMAVVPPASPLPLPLCSTSIFPNSSDRPTETFFSNIVLSTAMHAALLHFSESLRADHPGLERFKMAAERVMSYQFRGTLRIPSSAKIYSPKAKSFGPVSSSDTNEVCDWLDLHGPFAYALSSSPLISRLEPSFIISPLLSSLPPPTNSTMDLIVLRPRRSASVREAIGTEAEDGTWTGKVRAAMGGAYKGGTHVETLLEGSSDAGSRDGFDGGDAEVEVYRLEEWTWVPCPDSDMSHLVCADGAIHNIPAGGQAVCRVFPAEEGTGRISVWR